MDNLERLYSLFNQCGGRVSTNSRCIDRGGLFFALRGENFDGNSYAAQALQAGAGVVVVDRAEVSDGSDRYFVVSDSLKALQELASLHRVRCGWPLIAITGSNGKTTTKELMRLALGVKYSNVGYTRGNLNNHIGVPLTLLSFASSTHLGIVEMGASHQGEIAALCAIAQPDFGLITNIGRAHLEGFGGGDGVRVAKGELYDYLSTTNGVAVYNSDDLVLSAMVAERSALRSVAYSATQMDATPVSLFGAYNSLNVAAAYAVAVGLGVEPHQVARAIEGYKPDNNRSQVVQTERGNTLIVDCYNANPSSMALAVGEFVALPTIKIKVLILGQMGELGSFAASEHKRIVDLVGDVPNIFLVGGDFAFAAKRSGVRYFASTEDLRSFLVQKPLTDHTILIKGSRVVGLERAIELL